MTESQLIWYQEKTNIRRGIRMENIRGLLDRCSLASMDNFYIIKVKRQVPTLQQIRPHIRKSVTWKNIYMHGQKFIYNTSKKNWEIKERYTVKLTETSTNIKLQSAQKNFFIYFQNLILLTLPRNIRITQKLY